LPFNGEDAIERHGGRAGEPIETAQLADMIAVQNHRHRLAAREQQMSALAIITVSHGNGDLHIGSMGMSTRAATLVVPILRFGFAAILATGASFGV